MPVIHYSSPLQILVAVRGHPFDRTAFDAIFQSFDGVAATMVDQPAAMRLMNPDGMAGYHALVLYDMPGLDFAAQPAPRFVEPDARFCDGFLALLEQGIGVLALHHALAGWPAWPQYADLLGGAFLYRPGNLRGTPCADSGYRHNIRHHVRIATPHPVLEGIPDGFEIEDELYLAEVFEDASTPLLVSDARFEAEHFYSAAAAMDGRMYDNMGWSHADGSNRIAWLKRARNSPLIYLQPGDGPSAYDNPHYRRLVENSIRWLASPEALRWARTPA